MGGQYHFYEVLVPDPSGVKHEGLAADGRIAHCCSSFLMSVHVFVGCDVRSAVHNSLISIAVLGA